MFSDDYEKVCENCKYFDIDGYFCTKGPRDYIDKTPEDSCDQYEYWE